MNISPALRTTLNFGALSGLSGFLIFLALYYKGVNPLGQSSWLGSWIPVVFICISTKYIRNKLLGGFIAYWQAFRTGLLTGFFGALLFSLLIYIFGRIIDPSLVDLYKNEALQSLEETKFLFSDAFYEDSLKSINDISISQLAYNDFFMKLLGAALVSLITAAVYRKQPVNL